MIQADFKVVEKRQFTTASGRDVSVTDDFHTQVVFPSLIAVQTVPNEDAFCTLCM